MIITPITIRFYLRTDRATARKGIPIWVRILVRRKKIELYTYNNVAEEKHWDEIRGRVNPLNGSNANYTNQQLSLIETKVYETKARLERLGKEVNVENLRIALKETGGDSCGILQYMDDYIKKLKVLPDQYTGGTVKQYITTRNHLQAYLKSIGRKDLPLCDFSKPHLAGLEEFLMTEYVNKQYKRSLSRNSCSKYLTRLKTALKAAVRKDMISQSPFDLGFRMKYTKTMRRALTQEEVDRLMAYDFSANPSLCRVKDLFCFSIFTGLRFSDIMQLRISDVTQDKGGRYWLNIKIKKTKEFLNLPILKAAQGILEGYKDYQAATGFALPHLTNQKLNFFLRLVCEAANIPVCTFHQARHTCASTILLSNKIDLKSTSHWLAHTSTRSTELYTHVQRDLLEDLAKMLDKKMGL